MFLPDVRRGEAAEILPTFPADSFDALVTDPPYGLNERDHSAVALQAWAAGDEWFVPDGKGFVGCEWDRFVPPPGIWRQVLRVLKPGAPAAVFASPRTVDLMWHSLTLAGFEFVSIFAMVNGQSMPKARNVSRDIDNRLGATRTVVRGVKPGHENFADRQTTVGKGATGEHFQRPWMSDPEAVRKSRLDMAPATELAARYDGYATALKVAYEPVLIMRKPGPGPVRDVDVPFRYTPKAPTSERPTIIGDDGKPIGHPSVKPLAVMRHLVRHLSNPGQRILDAFGGSGTTGEATW